MKVNETIYDTHKIGCNNSFFCFIVVKKVLENEEAEKCVFRNLDNQTDLTNELKTLRLDVDQKKMNDDLFLPRLFTSEGKLYFSLY